MKKFFAGIALAVASVAAIAAPAPTALLTTSGATFAEFSGLKLGSDDIQGSTVNKTLFWMYESTNYGIDSYLLMFDPKASRSMAGTVTFSSDILFVADTRSSLLLTDPFFVKPGVTYDWKSKSGLEKSDFLAYSGNSLALNWSASSPGDYVRVLVTAVPEPESYAMFLAGLAIIGALARRNRA